MIEVLDHGFVRVVDSMGSDLSIVRNARVSYDAAWRAGEDEGGDTRLIRYLYKNGHNTPFEVVTITLEVKAPIFVLRQWQRHRTQSYNEVSARYRELPEEFYVPDPLLLGVQSPDSKQARIVGNALTRDQRAKAEYSCYRMKEACTASFQEYHELIAAGIPRELARCVLPVATYSHMFATVNLHNLFRFLSERLHPHAQYEIRVYAEAILKLIDPIAPVAVGAFKNQLEKL